ncbi:MAG: AAA family ATPase [Bdellovibrionota bacterium]
MSLTENITDSVHQELIEKVWLEAQKCIIDKPEEIRMCMIALLSGGHMLLEGSPGMGKTSLVRTLSKLFGLDSSRIQFTNDMLPADILGTSIFDKNTNSFEFHKGPIFSNFVLADEINRATPKTQSACLQAMEESNIDIDGKHYKLPQPFYVFATQNPVENIGTFPLPESQLDRFLMRIFMKVPSRAGEKQILLGDNPANKIDSLPSILRPEMLTEIYKEVQKIHLSEVVVDYILDIVEKSRTLSTGLSPRASQDLVMAARANAYIDKRDFVIPEDVQRVAPHVMNHRLGVNHLSGSDPISVCSEIIESIEIA